MKSTGEFALEQGMPVNEQAEKLILASILIGGNEVLTAAASVLSAEDFALTNHQTLFRVMRELDAGGTRIDHVHVAEILQRENLLDQISMSSLLDLESGMPRMPDISGYLRLVKDKSTLRRTIYACRAIANRCIAAGEESAEVLRDAEKLLAGLASESAAPSRWSTPSQVIREFPGGVQAFVTPSRNGAGIPFPWQELTDQTCGMQKGELIVIAARPGIGKTALALQICNHAAKLGYPPAYISLEMEDVALVRRLVSQNSRTDAQRMKAGYLNATERQSISRAISDFEDAPFWINDQRSLTHEGIRQALKRRASEGQISLIVVDHFHLVRGMRGQETRERYNDVADAGQGWAQEFDCPVIFLAQLNRECEKENRAPGLPDLKETGKLEENADHVGFIHRPETYTKNRGREDLRGIAQYILAKQRAGPVGITELIWLAGTQTFESREQ